MNTHCFLSWLASKKNFHASWWAYITEEPNDEIESLLWKKNHNLPIFKAPSVKSNLRCKSALRLKSLLVRSFVLCFTSFSFPINFASIRHQWVTFCIVSRKQKSWADEQLSRERTIATEQIFDAFNPFRDVLIKIPEVIEYSCKGSTKMCYAKCGLRTL